MALFMWLPFLFVSLASAVDNSLAACQGVANAFHNTCAKDSDGNTVAPLSVALMAGQSITKTMTGQTVCPSAGTQAGTSCTWTRKLCVSCSVVVSTTYIRVQTNDMPSSAGLSFGPEAPTEQNVDFSVKFRPPVSDQALAIDASTQAAVDSALCSMRPFAEKPASSDFKENAGETHFATAWVALDGILGWGTSSKSADPWFPPATWEDNDLVQEKVNNCLAHPAGGWWHYHSFAPAQWVDDGSTCEMYTAFALMGGTVDLRTLMFEGEDGKQMDGHKSLEVVGIALDGHPVMNAYVSETVNTLQGEGLDLCNGVIYDDDGDETHDSYAYFVTKTFPYNPGCFGPANYPSFTPGCTTNAHAYLQSPVLVAALKNTASVISAATEAPTSVATAAPTTATPSTAAPTTAAPTTAAPTTAAATTAVPTAAAATTAAPTTAVATPEPTVTTAASTTAAATTVATAAATTAAATTTCDYGNCKSRWGYFYKKCPKRYGNGKPDCPSGCDPVPATGCAVSAVITDVSRLVQMEKPAVVQPVAGTAPTMSPVVIGASVGGVFVIGAFIAGAFLLISRRKRGTYSGVDTNDEDSMTNEA